MLSTLPKLADKAFVVGFFLPTLLFVLSGMALFSDVIGVAWLKLVTGEERGLEKIVWVVLIVWTSAVFMLLINHDLYQILEGYRWPLSKLKSLRKRQCIQFDALSGRLKELRNLRDSHREEFLAVVEDELVEVWIALRQSFPRDKKDLLPTKFGNAILAFEQYATDVYGVDSVTLWFHLMSVVPPNFVSALNDARANVTVMVNGVFFSFAITLLSIARLGWLIIQQRSFNNWNVELSSMAVSYILVGLAGILVSRLAYNLSIPQAYIWGDLVKAAFDCYLPALASRLGYRLPASGSEQKKFWIAVSQRSAFFRPLRPEDWLEVGQQESTSSGGHQTDEGEDEDKHEKSGTAEGEDQSEQEPVSESEENGQSGEDKDGRD